MYQLEICDASTNREGRPQEYRYDLCERKLFYCLRQERDESRDCAVGDKANRDRQTGKKVVSTRDRAVKLLHWRCLRVGLDGRCRQE